MDLYPPYTARAICVRFHTDRPLHATPYQLKGMIIQEFTDHPIVPFINGGYRAEMRYPRVQVKVLRRELCLFGLGEGYQAVQSFSQELELFIIENQTYKVESKDAPEWDLQLDQSPTGYIRYKFITPWVALNQHAVAVYQGLSLKERILYLNRVLVQNLLFIARELGYKIRFEVNARVRLQTLTARVVVVQGSGSFKGYFTCNMILPDYLGLGHGITKGLGTIVQIES